MIFTPLGYLKLSGIDGSAGGYNIMGGYNTDALYGTDVSTPLAASDPIPTSANRVVIRPEAAIRFRDDGVAPTGADGFPIAANTDFVYQGDLRKFRMVSESGVATAIHLLFQFSRDDS